MALACAACGSEEGSDEAGADDDITYSQHVAPLFERCIDCHHTDSPVAVDIEDPFDPEKGLVNVDNFWWDSRELTPRRVVVPFDPDQSFLLWKLGDPNLPLDPALGGELMPLQIAPLSASQIQTLESWVSNGAQEDESFRNDVVPLFGNESRLGSAGGSCAYCHHGGTPNPPNLSDSFGPDGVVRVSSNLDASLFRVEPSDPDASTLILKVRATERSDALGLPMPPNIELLNDEEIAIVRLWIEQGARP